MRIKRSQGPFEQYLYIEEEVEIQSVREAGKKQIVHEYPFLPFRLESYRFYRMSTDTDRELVTRVKIGLFSSEELSEGKDEKQVEKVRSLLKKLEDEEVKMTGVSGYRGEEIFPKEIKIGDKNLEFKTAQKIPDRYYLIHDLFEDLESQHEPLP